MNVKVFDRSELKKRLQTLPQWKQAAFALAACERLFPFYLKFSSATKWGDPAVLRRAIDLAWESMRSDCQFRAPSQAATKAEAQAPDTEDFSSEYTSAALDAALSVANLMRILEHFDLELVLEIAQASFDSAYLLASLSPTDSAVTPAIHQQILLDSRVQNELDAQDSDLEFLRTLQGDFGINSDRLRSQIGSAIGVKDHRAR